MLVALLCMAVYQAPSEPDGVQAIVDKLIPVSKVSGMPQGYAQNRILRAEVAGLDGQPAGKEGDDEDEEAPAVEVRGVNMRQIKISMDCYDLWVFGNMLNEDMRKAWLDGKLREKLLGSGRRHHLSSTELEKLHLAGRGDIKRLRAEADRRRIAFERQRQDIQVGQTALIALKPMSARFEQGPFGADSIYDKTLAKILDDRKAAK